MMKTALVLGLVTVRTPRDLDALGLQTEIAGVVVGAVSLLLAAAVAQAIKFQGGKNPKDPSKRRLWFWLLMAAGAVGFFLVNFYVIQPTVAPNLQPQFMNVNAIGTVIVIGTHVLGGFLLSKAFSTGKLASWFPSSR